MKADVITLDGNLYNRCLEYLDKKGIMEYTKEQYIRLLKVVFKKDVLTQMVYSIYYNKGGAYKSIIKLIPKVCDFYDIGIYRYKEISKKPTNRKLPQVWTEEEVYRIIHNIDTYGLLLSVAYHIGSGLRFSSAILVKWSDFMWEDWLVDTSKSGKCYIYAKGGKEKYLPVDKELMKELYDIAESKSKLWMGVPYKNFSGINYLFITDDEYLSVEKEIEKEKMNNMITNDVVYSMKINKDERIKLKLTQMFYRSVDYQLEKLNSMFHKKIKFHSIRSSKATTLLKKGFPLIYVKKLLMHTSISTTQIYIKLVDEDLQSKYDDLI